MLVRKGTIPADRSEEAIGQRLVEATAEVEHYERMLTAAKRRRDLLVRKLLHAGFPERTIAPIAGVSPARIHQIRLEAKEVDSQ